MQTTFRLLVLSSIGTFALFPVFPVVAQVHVAAETTVQAISEQASKSKQLKFSFSSAGWTDVLEWFSEQARSLSRTLRGSTIRPKDWT